VLASDTIAGLAEALLERDRYTGEHSESVAELAVQVAYSLGLDERRVEQVRTAAVLHDIGKVGIPDDVLHKPGKLSAREWDTMREHPVIGERIVRTIPGLGPVARIVRHEHERWDGDGYPDGLAGEAIPIGSRIILACDAYHAMTSDRPYRRALSHGDAVRELTRGAGNQFDPAVTKVLIRHLWRIRRPAAGAAA
jgi:putative nucleotidyltransferase with HDIG domain